MRVTGNTTLFRILWPHTVFFVRRFYRQFKVKGFEKVPAQHPVLFAPNHQNAFMDALVLLEPSGWNHQLSYLVRASIFNNRLASYFLHKINMLPVYRKDVDGVENIDKNEEVFENCVYLMANRRRLVLFPEGTHHVKRRMLPLKKGITRIAFSAEERHNFTLDVLIVPVGINYSAPSEFGSNVLVLTGDPIRVKDYEALYRESPAKAHNRIKSELETRLRALMIDIRNEEYYELIERLRPIDASEKEIRDVEEEFHNSKALIARAETFIAQHPEEAVQLRHEVGEYSKLLEQASLRDKVLAPGYKAPSFLYLLSLVLLLPVYLTGVLQYYLPFRIPLWITRRYIKDPGFRSSIKTAVSMLIFPLFHAGWTLIFYLLTGKGWLTLAFFLLSPLTADVALWWQRTFLKFTAYRRFQRFIRTEAGQRARVLRTAIVNRLRNF